MIAFAFADTNSEAVLKRIKHPGLEKFYLQSDKLYIESFLDYLALPSTNTDFVIGMGQYGRQSSDIRIEQLCRNKFRREPIVADGPDEIYILPFFFINDHMMLTQGMGNSWCNYISYLIRHQLGLDHYAFLHIPKNFTNAFAARSIAEQLPKAVDLSSLKGMPPGMY